MRELLLLAGAIGLGIVLWRGVPIGYDATRRGLSLRDAFVLGLRNVVRPENYWWRVRLELLTQVERETILGEAATRADLSRIDSVRCPLCGTEIVQALTLTRNGRLASRPDTHCPDCDFRLDSCRHCQYFLPARGMGMAGFDWNGASWGLDYGYGRCTMYKDVVPVARAGLADHVAKALLERGYETIRAPRPIVDSYMPPDYCRAFLLDERRLRLNDVRLDRKRRYWLRLLQL